MLLILVIVMKIVKIELTWQTNAIDLALLLLWKVSSTAAIFSVEVIKVSQY